MTTTESAKLARPDRGAERASRFTDTLRSEWTKFRSLPSSLYTLAVTAILSVGFGALFSRGSAGRYGSMSAADQAGFDPAQTSLQGFLLAQLAVGLLGVLVITSEYATGMIRASMIAVPRRGRLLAAKAAVIAVVAFVVGTVVAFVAFNLGQLLISSRGAPEASLSESGVARAIVGTGLYLMLIGLFGVALGTVLRATAGALTALFALTLLVPLLTPVLPESLARFVGKYWPTQAGAQITGAVPDPQLLSPWVGLGVLAASVAGILGLAFALFLRRDA